MKTKIFKANGKTFYSIEDVQTYANENNFVITDTVTFKHKNNIITSVNLTSVK